MIQKGQQDRRLTDEQLAVVHHPQGHVLVRAVPGSGKTLTLEHRVTHLLKSGADPNRILCVMFNKAPAAQFAERITQQALQIERPPPRVRTFHAIGHRLRQTLISHGALPALRLDEGDRSLASLATKTLSHFVRERQGKAAMIEPSHKDSFMRFIELVKADIRPPEEVFAQSGFAPEEDFLLPAFYQFEEDRKKQGICFYSDLIWESVRCLFAKPELVSLVADRLDHIIVDEYQDVNAAQQQLLITLAGDRASVMAVGDDDQSIYAWRGANPAFITTRFEQDFPGTTCYTLTRTFRYGHELALAANHVISCNRHRARKLCIADESNPDTRITLHFMPTKIENATAATHPIVQVLNDWRLRRPLNAAAVLLRLWNMGVPIELALLQAGIPYRLHGRGDAFTMREINGLLGILRLASGRLFDQPKEILQKSVEDMLVTPHLGVPTSMLQQVARDIVVSPKLAQYHIAGLAAHGLRMRQIDTVRRRADIWEAMIGGVHAHRPPGRVLAEYAEQTDLIERVRSLASTEEEAEDRVLACEAMLEHTAVFHGTTAEYLEIIEGLRARQREMSRHDDAVQIMTVHRAKGLEWPLVILPGLSDRDFPYRQRRGEEDIEAERRLFYVAATRAREHLALIAPSDGGLIPHLEGGMTLSNASKNASRFLYETNLVLSAHVAAALHNRPGNRRQVTGHRLNIIEQYLEAVAVPYRQPQQEVNVV